MSLFGSYVRGEAKEGSNVNLYVINKGYKAFLNDWISKNQVLFDVSFLVYTIFTLRPYDQFFGANYKKRM